MVALAKIPVSMSTADFLAWNPGDAQPWQLVDGEPQAMAPASLVHGALQTELGSLIRDQFRRQGVQCVVVANPGIVPHVQAARNFRIPDLGVTCSPLEAGAYSLPDPLLIVEILSPSNQSETWANVWAYVSIPSVREILVLHTASIGADILRRGPDGNWPQEPERIEDGDLLLDSIGFQTPLAGLYRDTHLHRPSRA